MLEVGYLNLENPIAITCSNDDFQTQGPNHQFNGSAGLLILDELDLDRISLREIEATLNEIKTTSSLGFSVKCSEDEPLIEAARFAARNLYLMELDALKETSAKRLSDLVNRIKRCGTTLSAKISPEMLTEDLARALRNSGLDIVHLNLSGMTAPAQR